MASLSPYVQTLSLSAESLLPCVFDTERADRDEIAELSPTIAGEVRRFVNPSCSPDRDDAYTSCGGCWPLGGANECSEMSASLEIRQQQRCRQFTQLNREFGESGPRTKVSDTSKSAS